MTKEELFQLREQHPMEVQFESNDVSHEFIITLTRPIGESVQESVQERNSQSNQESNQENIKFFTGKQLASKGLTKEQVTIVLYCTIPRTAAEIFAKIGVSVQTKNREAHINPLLEQGYLQYTIPSNPKDRNQKYVRVK